MSRSIRFFVPTVFALLLAGVWPAEPAAAQEPIRTAAYDVRELEYPPLREFEVPEPERMELDNGMTILLLEDHELPQVRATARIAGGSVHEPADRVGLASLTGTVMRTGGTASMGPDSVNQVLEGLGASVETGMGQTSGSASMSTLKEHVDVVLPVFAEVLRRPAFDPEKVDLARSQQKSLISRRNDNPQQIAFREFDKLVYGEDSPYARHAEYYTIDAIDREDLVDFHEEYVQPANVILSVWGDFDTGTMKRKLREAFGNWSNAPDYAEPSTPEPTAERAYSVSFIQKDDVNQSTVLMGHPGELRRSEPDYPPVIVMNEVLSGGFSGRLFQNVRKDQGLAYSVFGNYTAGYDRPGRFFAGVFTRSETTVEAADAVTREIEKLREAPPTGQELRLAKDSYLNSFVFNFDTKREILSRLMTYEHHGYPADFLQRTQEAIQRVTAEDVHRVSRDYLYPDESHVLVVGRRQDFSRDLATLTGDGGVREIDISIPTSPPGQAAPAATAQELEGGAELLTAARDALGGDTFRRLENMVVEQETVRRMGQGEVTIPATSIVALPDRLRQEQTLPNGMTITVVDDGERMMFETPQGTQAAPDRVRRQFTSQLWRNLAYLMANLERVEVQARDLGTGEVEGTSYRVVEVTPPAGEPFTLYLDPETLRPARMEYTETGQQGPRPATDVFEDYRDVSGLTVPFRTVTYQDGEQVAESRMISLEINVELEEGLFTLDGGP